MEHCNIAYSVDGERHLPRLVEDRTLDDEGRGQRRRIGRPGRPRCDRGGSVVVGGTQGSQDRGSTEPLRRRQAFHRLVCLVRRWGGRSQCVAVAGRDAAAA